MVIYLTTNLINNKKYIGKDRHNSPSYLGGGVALREDIKTYGRSNFTKEILEICSDLDMLKYREIYWLEYYDASSNPEFYNLTNKSHGSINGPTKTNLYLNRGSSISQSRTGKHYPEASMAQRGLKKPKVSKALTGKKKTEMHCINLSNSKKGIPSKRKGKPDLKQKGVPKPGVSEKTKGIPKPGAGPKEGKHIIDINTGVEFNSVKSCMEFYNIGKSKMYAMLKNPNSNIKYK
jgi:group I intron endonuclease